MLYQFCNFIKYSFELFLILASASQLVYVQSCVWGGPYKRPLAANFNYLSGL